MRPRRSSARARKHAYTVSPCTRRASLAWFRDRSPTEATPHLLPSLQAGLTASFGWVRARESRPDSARSKGRATVTKEFMKSAERLTVEGPSFSSRCTRATPNQVCCCHRMMTESSFFAYTIKTPNFYPTSVDGRIFTDRHFRGAERVKY